MILTIDTAAVLAALITPAVLISASGTLVLSTSNRLSRVTDRVRALADRLEALGPPKGASGPARRKVELYRGQIPQLAERIVLLRRALIALYAAIGLFISTSLVVALATAFGPALQSPALVLGLLGTAALLWGSLELVTEARRAVASTIDELEYVRELTSPTGR